MLDFNELTDSDNKFVRFQLVNLYFRIYEINVNKIDRVDQVKVLTLSRSEQQGMAANMS